MQYFEVKSFKTYKCAFDYSSVFRYLGNCALLAQPISRSVCVCINNDNNNYPAKGSSLLALEQWPQSSSQLSCSLLHLREELNSCSQLRNAPNSASRALRLLAQAEHDSTTQVFNSKPIVKPRRESVICRTLWRAPRAKLNSIDGCPSSALHSTLDIEKKYYRNYVMYSCTIKIVFHQSLRKSLPQGTFFVLHNFWKL